jgi:hypothetical protein
MSMPDDTQPMPPDWKPSACPGFYCPPGSKSVTITASDCDSHASFNAVSFTVTDSTGWLASSVNGFVVICCGYAGYTFTASAATYDPKTHTLTQEEVDAQHVDICLKKKPPTTTRPPDCLVHTLTATKEFKPTARMLAPYYRVRDLLAATPQGGKLVDLYYDPDTKQRTFEAIQNSPELRSEGLALVLEIGHILRDADRNVLPGTSAAAGCDCDTQPLLDPEVMRRGERFLDDLESASGATELIEMVRELAQAGRQGLGEVMRWLNTEED